MNKYKKIGLGVVLGSYFGLASGLVGDYGPRQEATEYHLQQAYYKLGRQEYAYAWGEFAYLLCRDPVNHEVLEQMLAIAGHVDRQVELDSYFTKALLQNPEDQYIQDLYKQFQAQAVVIPTRSR